MGNCLDGKGLKRLSEEQIEMLSLIPSSKMLVYAHVDLLKANPYSDEATRIFTSRIREAAQFLVNKIPVQATILV